MRVNGTPNPMTTVPSVTAMKRLHGFYPIARSMDDTHTSIASPPMLHAYRDVQHPCHRIRHWTPLRGLRSMDDTGFTRPLLARSSPLCAIVVFIGYRQIQTGMFVLSHQHPPSPLHPSLTPRYIKSPGPCPPIHRPPPHPYHPYPPPHSQDPTSTHHRDMCTTILHFYSDRLRPARNSDGQKDQMYSARHGERLGKPPDVCDSGNHMTCTHESQRDSKPDDNRSICDSHEEAARVLPHSSFHG